MIQLSLPLLMVTMMVTDRSRRDTRRLRSLGVVGVSRTVTGVKFLHLHLRLSSLLRPLRKSSGGCGRFYPHSNATLRRLRVPNLRLHTEGSTLSTPSKWSYPKSFLHRVSPLTPWSHYTCATGTPREWGSEMTQNTGLHTRLNLSGRPRPSFGPFAAQVWWRPTMTGGV